MTSQPDTATPIEAATKGQLIDYALQIEAMGKGIATYGAVVREELRQRGVTELTDSGVRPSWELKGRGKVILNAPGTTIEPDGSQAFTNWLLDSRPTEVTATLTVSTKDLPNVLLLLDEQGYTDDIKLTLTARDAYVKGLLDREKGRVDVVTDWPDCDRLCKRIDGNCRVHRPERTFLDRETSEVIPGLALVSPKAPWTTVKLDATLRDTIAEALGMFLDARLAKGLETGSRLEPLALLAPLEPGDRAGDPADEPAVTDGSTTTDDNLAESAVCQCSHTDGQHRKGQKQYGKCLVDDCWCRRFAKERKIE